MFYKMIQRKRDAWYTSAACSIQGILRYMQANGHLRDAQLDAIKTYLYLKIAAGNQSLYDLFVQGFFNSLDLDTLKVSARARAMLRQKPATAALYEFAAMKTDSGQMLSKNVVRTIEEDPDKIDSRAVFYQIFFEKSYTEYLFSLPMGAGKTFLMAAFIYLDLYFAMLEPKNPAFAHNFIILVPSGLKSSVVPSLRTIQRFDPAWVLAEPAASQVKRLLKFEVLDAQKAQAKSNRAKNPNVQKIALHQSEPDLVGLVAVTNAEKVILDRISYKNGQLSLFTNSDDDKDRQANELRNRIGKLPGLAIFIDEAHHAADDDIKLRGVVNQWMQNEQHTINSVIGFSGTPYLAKAERVYLSDTLYLQTEEISTIVYYYRLVDGIGNFLKRPVVKKAAQGMESIEIVNHGLHEFFDRYRDTRYENGCWTKLAIFCSNIDKLEDMYSYAAGIVEEYGLEPSEVLLKFHRGNKKYPVPEGAQLEFDSLDTELSRKRVILLAEIGKEGWDCRSLTGVILSQKGDCPMNKVLQTSCRCLRQVMRGQIETALIYLNEDNAKLLEKQLLKQHHLTVAQFENGGDKRSVSLPRYTRMEHLRLPEIAFCQLEVEYTMEISRQQKNVDQAILAAVSPDAHRPEEMIEQDFSGCVLDSSEVMYGIDYAQPAQFLLWLNQIAKESFGTLTVAELRRHEASLQVVYQQITEIKDDLCCYRKSLRQSVVRANIRRAFAEDWHYQTQSEVIPLSASLLNVANFAPMIETTQPDRYYPEKHAVENILQDDAGQFTMSAKAQAAIDYLEESNPAEAKRIKIQEGLLPNKDRSFHYLPYHMDSHLEIEFLQDLLPEDILEQKNLEVYYNGDRSLTGFRIKCYEKRSVRDWAYVGMYTPDFLILQRQAGAIARVIIVETKGSLYANDPNFIKRRRFMETVFKKNNPNFDYLYLEDSMSGLQHRQLTRDAIQRFFQEVH